MPDNNYKYLSALIREGSFSKAAQALDISQPALSQFILRTEAEAGCSLVDRAAKPLRLTYAGEVYLKSEKRINDLRRERAKILADIDSGVRGQVRIGSSHYRSTFFLTAVLPVFRQLYPEIEISLEEGTTSQLEEFASSGRTDISLVLLPLERPELDYRQIYTEKLLLAVSTGSRLYKKLPADVLASGELPFTYLDGEPFIIIKRGQKFRTLFNDMCDTIGVAPNVLLESESPIAALYLASAGLGTTFVTETLAKRCRTPGELKFFELSPAQPRRVVVAAYRKDGYLSKAASSLIDVMTMVGENQFANG